jgi:enoyl-CoA hydratase/carnithine racemase
LLTHVDDHVGVITLNRPARHNALNDELTKRYVEALRSFIARDEIRCILLRAQGRSFCSGRDVSELGKRASGESDFLFVRRHQRQLLEQMDAHKPIIAALKGAVLGGGCEIALAADIRVASSDLQLGLPEINYGLLPDTGGTQLLTALIGASRTKYLILSGEPLDAATALAWGAVDFVVGADLLDQRTLEIARLIAAKPPLAVAMGKQMVDQLHGPQIRNGIGQELLAQTALFLTEDYREARAALREKRKPRYKGR